MVGERIKVGFFSRPSNPVWCVPKISKLAMTEGDSRNCGAYDLLHNFYRHPQLRLAIHLKQPIDRKSPIVEWHIVAIMLPRTSMEDLLVQVSSSSCLWRDRKVSLMLYVLFEKTGPMPSCENLISEGRNNTASFAVPLVGPHPCPRQIMDWHSNASCHLAASQNKMCRLVIRTTV